MLQILDVPGYFMNYKHTLARTYSCGWRYEDGHSRHLLGMTCMDQNNLMDTAGCWKICRVFFFAEAGLAVGGAEQYTSISDHGFRIIVNV